MKNKTADAGNCYDKTKQWFWESNLGAALDGYTRRVDESCFSREKKSK